jgi:hypothetical protein
MPTRTRKRARSIEEVRALIPNEFPSRNHGPASSGSRLDRSAENRGYCSGFGMLKRSVAPESCALSALTEPPCASTICFTTSRQTAFSGVRRSCATKARRSSSLPSINGEIDCRPGPRQPARRAPGADKTPGFLRLFASQCWPASSDDTGGRQWRGRGRRPHTIRETSGNKVTAVNLSYLAVSRTPTAAPTPVAFWRDLRGDRLRNCSPRT